MPVHDWSRVEAGIFHHFHHAWIEEIKRALNRGVLPADYYAMAEQHAAGFGPDVPAIRWVREENDGRNGDAGPSHTAGAGGMLLAEPKLRPVAETDMAFYRRKQSTLAVRHVSGDRIVAMVEIVSPGNKAGRNAVRAFVEKAAELLDNRIHLLIIDLHAPGKRNPHGIHAEIWEDITGEEQPAAAKPLTVASYESGLVVRAYVVPVAVGEALPEMPLFLEPGAHVLAPLEATYQAAFAAVPRRWQRVLEAPG